jgi:hypothetical protein
MAMQPANLCRPKRFSILLHELAYTIHDSTSDGQKISVSAAKGGLADLSAVSQERYKRIWCEASLEWVLFELRGLFSLNFAYSAVDENQKCCLCA